MLKTLNTKLTKSRKSVIKVGDDNKKGYGDKIKLDGRDEIDGNEINDNKIRDNNIAEEKNY